jgi:type III secretion protein L
MSTFRLLRASDWAIELPNPVLQPDELGALLDARELLATCEAQARALTRQGIEALDEQSRRGFEQGLAQGAAAIAERLLEFEHERAEWLAGRHRQVVDLVVLVLERVAPALREGRLVRALVHQAVLEARHAPRLHVKVNPECVAAVEADLEALRRSCPWLESLEVDGVEGMAVDDCLLESPHGFIQAGWSTQLAAIRHVLDDLAASESAEDDAE